MKKKRIKKTTMPLVSVVMPVFNASLYLCEAIDSILNQTYKNIELIIIDDKSTDDSYAILKRYERKYPKKITVLQNCHHHHLAHVISKAMVKAKGEFIARMDGDDIALPNRFEKQVAYLLKHKKTVAVGSQCLLIDGTNAVIGEKTFPTSFKDIYKYIYSFCPMQHPTMMIAAFRLPEDFQYYNLEMPFAEDIELIFKLFQYGKVENLPDYLLMYRMHGKNVTTNHLKQVFVQTLLARIRAVFSFGYRPTPAGVLVTCMQAIIMLVLPTSKILAAYNLVRKLSPSQFTLNESLALEVSKAL